MHEEVKGGFCLNKRFLVGLAPVALVLTLAVAFAACGGDDSTTTGTPKAGTATAGSSSSATAAASHTATPAASHAATPAASSAAASTVATAANSALGKTILVNARGMTLYKYDQDTSGASNCTGSCATAWPPLTVTSGTSPTGGSGVTGTLATITRPDGTKQVTYNGAPLYTWKQDTKAGDVTGDGVNSFHAVTP
jgi:predicted lipoprotein with Yx(FWY)xxD motif